MKTTALLMVLLSTPALAEDVQLMGDSILGWTMSQHQESADLWTQRTAGLEVIMGPGGGYARDIASRLRGAPTVLVLWFGCNDVVNTEDTPETVAGYFTAGIEKSFGRGTRRVVIVSTIPLREAYHGSDRVAPLDSLLRAMASDRVSYVDVTEAMTDSSCYIDVFHPSAKGSARMVPPIATAVRQQVASAYGDLDSDLDIDFDDFGLFADAFGRTGPADLDYSGVVDYDDFFLFADHFGVSYREAAP